MNQDYDEGIIDGSRYHRTAAERVRAELTATEGKRAASGGLSGTSSVLGAPDPVEAFDAASS